MALLSAWLHNNSELTDCVPPEKCCQRRWIEPWELLDWCGPVSIHGGCHGKGKRVLMATNSNGLKPLKIELEKQKESWAESDCSMPRSLTFFSCKLLVFAFIHTVGLSGRSVSKFPWPEQKQLFGGVCLRRLCPFFLNGRRQAWR